MHPLIPDGTPVLVAPLRGRRPRTGDIVLFQGAGGLVLHRVVALRGDMVTTRGDACPASDPPVRVDALLGRAVLAIRRGRALPLDGPGLRLLGLGLSRLLALLRGLRGAVSGPSRCG